MSASIYPYLFGSIIRAYRTTAGTARRAPAIDQFFKLPLLFSFSAFLLSYFFYWKPVTTFMSF